MNKVLDLLRPQVKDNYTEYRDKMLATDDDFEVEYYQKKISEKGEFVRAILSDGDERKKLFNNLRKEIRTLASV